MGSTELVPTEQLREKLRRSSELQRRTEKGCSMDSLRLGLGEIQSMISELENLTVKDVHGLCVRIKRKKHASSEDMFRLSHAFLQGDENISEFVKNIGGINVLVKELTGHDAELQIKACETLCNLSLGGTVPCEKIALNAGSYLVTYLDSTDLRLKLSSFWVISNIAATGGKGLQILVSLEIVPKLVHLWSTEENEEILEEITIALDLIISSAVLRTEDKTVLQECLLKGSLKKLFGEYHLKYIFESLIAPDVSLNEIDQATVVNFCVTALRESEDLRKSGGLLKLLYSVRILSNIICIYPNSATIFVERIRAACVSVTDALNMLLERDEAVKEVLWFIKNCLSSENSDLKMYLQENGILQELKVGRFSVPESL